MAKEIYGSTAVRRALYTHITLRVASIFVAFLFQIIVVKKLPPEEFANYAVLLGLLTAAVTFFTFGLDRAIQRFLPNYLQQKDIKRLRSLGAQLGLIRLSSIVIFLFVAVVGVKLWTYTIPIKNEHIILVAFSIWFIASILFADGDALAQSCVAHVDLAFIYTLEILMRTAAVLFLATQSVIMTAEMIVIVSALTTTAAVIALSMRLLRFWQNFRNVVNNGTRPEQGGELDVSRAPRFAAAAYISAISWLVSSPSLIRLAARSGLSVIPFSAFSFAQGSLIALQKVLPGGILLSSLEPLMAAELAGRARQERVYAAMALTFKVELIAVLMMIIVTAVAGSDILRVLTRPEYAPFYLVMPGLAIMVPFYTMFRTLEIIGFLKLRQKIFLMLWPLGVFCVLGIYLTVHRWGLLSIIVFPIIEYTAKLSILLKAFHRDGVWSAFDPRRSVLLVLTGGVTLSAALLLQTLEVTSIASDISIALGAIVVFSVLIMLLRPLRPVEYDTALMLLPRSWSFVQKFIFLLTHP